MNSSANGRIISSPLFCELCEQEAGDLKTSPDGLKLCSKCRCLECDSPNISEVDSTRKILICEVCYALHRLNELKQLVRVCFNCKHDEENHNNAAECSEQGCSCRGLMA